MQLLTCFVKKEEHQYASLCVELDVASCGKTKKKAIEGLKNAIEAYIEHMVSQGRGGEIYRPVPMGELGRYFNHREHRGGEKSKGSMTQVQMKSKC